MRRVSLARYCPGLMVFMALMLAIASPAWSAPATPCLLYTSDAADE